MIALPLFARKLVRLQRAAAQHMHAASYMSVMTNVDRPCGIRHGGKQRYHCNGEIHDCAQQKNKKDEKSSMKMEDARPETMMPAKPVLHASAGLHPQRCRHNSVHDGWAAVRCHCYSVACIVFCLLRDPHAETAQRAKNGTMRGRTKKLLRQGSNAMINPPLP